VAVAILSADSTVNLNAINNSAMHLLHRNTTTLSGAVAWISSRRSTNPRAGVWHIRGAPGLR